MRLTIRIAAAALALLAACSQAKAPEPRALLWKVSDADNSLYLLGSFHALKPDDYPLPATVQAAFADAERLAFEVPPAEMQSPQLAGLMLKAARLPVGQRLSDVLPPATLARLKAYCRDKGLDAANLEAFAPWFVSLTLLSGEMVEQGFDPKLGLDRHLMAQAADAGKPTSGLETAADQIGLLSGMPLSVQREMLDEFLDDAKDGEDSLDALHASWRRGDEKAIEAEMVKELAARYADLYRRINVDRNQAWLPQLRGMLDRAGTDDTLVVVGALHLVGRDGLVQQLQAKGYRVERL
jgi:uncharacterized protein YbaP (TraB family)